MSPLSVELRNSSDGLLATGPLLPIQIGLDETYEPGGLWESSAPLLSRSEGADALIDTGARVSCIDTGLAERLRLPIADEDALRGLVGSPISVRTRLGHLVVTELQIIRPLRFYEVDLSSWLSHEVLLGRDMLEGCQMHYDGESGNVTVARRS